MAGKPTAIWRMRMWRLLKNFTPQGNKYITVRFIHKRTEKIRNHNAYVHRHQCRIKCAKYFPKPRQITRYCINYQRCHNHKKSRESGVPILFQFLPRSFQTSSPLSINSYSLYAKPTRGISQTTPLCPFGKHCITTAFSSKCTKR